MFLKPQVTKTAAKEYGYAFDYASRPAWPTYASLLAFAERVRRDQRDLGPRDMIDLQSFIWVQGSDEYEEGAAASHSLSPWPLGRVRCMTRERRARCAPP